MIDPRGGTRATAVAAALIGLLIATAVIAYHNFGVVLTAMKPIGATGFVVVAAAQVALFAPLGLAWWSVAPDEPIRRLGAYVWASLVAEAATNILPFSQFGGVLAANRAAVLSGAPPATAFGSNVVDITLEVAAQLVFTLVGVALLVGRLGIATGHDPLLQPLLAGLGLSSCLVGGFVATQRRGLRVIERLIHRMIPAADNHAAAVTRVVETAYGRPLRLWTGFALHIGAWFATALGTWLILAFIGHPLPLLSVVAIESLLFAIRNAAFFVPGGLGVQESAYALLGPLFGLPVEAALALSLLKRARDITIGVPVLIGWQIAEGRRRRHSA